MKKKSIKITKTFTNKVKGKTFDLIDPKTSNSNRIVDLDEKITKLLWNHYIEEKKLYDFNQDMFIFGNIIHVAPTTFKNHLDKYINITREKSGNKNFKRITPHGFRHSHVSLLIHLGCDSREVAERIGDTVQMVEKTYYHMFPEKRKHTISVLNNLKI